MISRTKRPLARRAIYKPSGPAAEYAVWGCNLYKGCAHQCSYCYLHRGPMAQQLGGSTPEIEKKVGGTAEKAFQRFCLEVDAYQEQFVADGGIFFSFSTDPMQHEEVDLTMRCALYALERMVPVYILTKATWWIKNDRIVEPLWVYSDLVHIGFSLTGHDELEPGADSNVARQSAIIYLHKMQFHTFASMEPVIDFESSLAVIETIKDDCEEFRIGLLSPYSPKRYDWHQCDRFISRVTDLSNEIGFRVVWKESIKKFYQEEKPNE